MALTAGRGLDRPGGCCQKNLACDVVVLPYIRFPPSLRNVEDLLHERGVDISHKTVRFWWNRFGPTFAADPVQALKLARYSPGVCPIRARNAALKAGSEA